MVFSKTDQHWLLSSGTFGKQQYAGYAQPAGGPPKKPKSLS
jgi:hypothetical protein